MRIYSWHNATCLFFGPGVIEEALDVPISLVKTVGCWDSEMMPTFPQMVFVRFKRGDGPLQCAQPFTHGIIFFSALGPRKPSTEVLEPSACIIDFGMARASLGVTPTSKPSHTRVVHALLVSTAQFEVESAGAAGGFDCRA